MRYPRFPLGIGGIFYAFDLLFLEGLLLIAVQDGHGGTPRTGSKRFVEGVNCPGRLSQLAETRHKTLLKPNGAKYGGFSAKPQVNSGE